jgi:hypothetical protein
MATVRPDLGFLSEPAFAPFRDGFLAWDETRAAAGVPGIEVLWREWHPLRGAMLPVGPGTADDPLLVPCVAPARGRNGGVFLWDFAGQLDEQAGVELATSHAEWQGLDRSRRDERIADARVSLEQARASSPEWRAAMLERFSSVAAEFGVDAGYDHEGGGRLPRAVHWRPVRVACQDILLAVAAVRFNRDKFTIDVCAWAAADHTKFARSAGVRNALELVAAEAARHGAIHGVRFVSLEGRPEPVSPDIRAFLHLLGLAPAAGRRLTDEVLRPLNRFLASAQEEFPALCTASFWAETAARQAGMLEAELLHLRRQRVWSDGEITALAEHCPGAADVLRGRVSPETHGLAFDAAWAHLRAARLIDATVRTIQAVGAERGPLPEQPAADRASWDPLPGTAYGRRVSLPTEAVTALDFLEPNGELGPSTQVPGPAGTIDLVPLAVAVEQLLPCLGAMRPLPSDMVLLLPARSGPWLPPSGGGSLRRWAPPACRPRFPWSSWPRWTRNCSTRSVRPG